MGNMCCDDGAAYQLKASVPVFQNSTDLKTELKCTTFKKLARSIGYTPPLLVKDNNILLIKSLQKSGFIYIKYKVYDLKTETFIKEKAIEQKTEIDYHTTEIYKSEYIEYTYNPDNDSIYFIVMNKNVIVLDLNTDKISDLNISITTDDYSYAKIVYHKQKIYIIGANNEQSNDANIVMVPYTKRTKDFGKYARTVITNQTVTKRPNPNQNKTIKVNDDYIYIWGGQTSVGKKYSKTDHKSAVSVVPKYIPNGLIRVLKCGDSDKKHAWTDFSRRVHISETKLSQFLTSYPVRGCGVINYKNEYLFQFGGLQLKKKTIQPTSDIYVLPLSDDNKYGLQQWIWYELVVTLPGEPDEYHVIYPQKNAKEIIHFFSYKGVHLKVSMRDILDSLAKGVHLLQPWSQCGSIMPFMQSKGLTEFGLNENSEVSEVGRMLLKMGEEYEDYWDILDAHDIETFEELIVKKEVLDGFITDTNQWRAIVAKAEELLA